MFEDLHKCRSFFCSASGHLVTLAGSAA
jgi:hypothetical protein